MYCLYVLLLISSEDKLQYAYHILSEIDGVEEKFVAIRIGRIDALEKRHAFFQVAQNRQATCRIWCFESDFIIFVEYEMLLFHF